MKRNSSPTLLIVLVAFVLGIGISACGAGSQKWEEEVKLSDGRTIVIARELLFEGGGGEWATNPKGIKPKEYRIQIPDPAGSGKMVEWKSTKLSPRRWPEIPLDLDVESGQPIIFSLVAISIGCEVYSKYVYKNGAWAEDVLPEKFEQHATNLFFGDGNNMPRFLNLAEKYRRNSGDGYRRALKQVGPLRKVCG